MFSSSARSGTAQENKVRIVLIHRKWNGNKPDRDISESDRPPYLHDLDQAGRKQCKLVLIWKRMTQLNSLHVWTAATLWVAWNLDAFPNNFNFLLIVNLELICTEIDILMINEEIPLFGSTILFCRMAKWNICCFSMQGVLILSQLCPFQYIRRYFFANLEQNQIFANFIIIFLDFCKIWYYSLRIWLNY